MHIAGREIGPHMPPYIVAEISGNHGGDLNKALELIDAAKDCGADAAKIQLYKPTDLASPGSRYWSTYQECCVPVDWLPSLFERARKRDIAFFSSVFASWAVDELEKHNAPAYKIASPEAHNRALIHKCQSTGKPVIASTGMCDTNYAPRVDVLLHCVAKYPASLADSNLRCIQWWSRSGAMTGLSDHTIGIEAPIAATALGAVMIEKHFALDENCIDGEFSLTPLNFSAMVRSVHAVWAGLGNGIPVPTCGPREIAA